MEEALGKIIIGIILILLSIIPAIAQMPDLTVTEINVSTNNPILYGVTNEIFVDRETIVNATLENIGFVDANNFDVVLYADGNEIERKTISLNSGEKKVINFNWHTPRNVGIYKLKVYVDPELHVKECNETNNYKTKDQYVTENGYKGTKPLITYIKGTINGGVILECSNNSLLGNMMQDETVIVHFDINKIQGKVKLARLYVYWSFAEDANSKSTAADFVVMLNDNTLRLDRCYIDIIGYGNNSTYGTYAYNVTNIVKYNNKYVVTVRNMAYRVYITGICLLIIYEDKSAEKIQYWINEGCDYIATEVDGHIVASPVEASTSAPFIGSIEVNNSIAWLYTVVPYGSNGKNKLFFNNGEWKGLWNNSKGDIAINNLDVASYLKGTNVAWFQDRGDGICPSTAILIIGGNINQYKEPEIIIKDYSAAPNQKVTSPIMIKGANNIGAGTIKLEYNSSVVKITEVKNGDFDAIEYNIQNAFNYTLISVYQINNGGLSREVTFAKIVFEANITSYNYSHLNLTDSYLAYINCTPVPKYSIRNGTFRVIDIIKLNVSANKSVIVNDNKDTVKIIVNITQSCANVTEVIIDLSNIGGPTEAKMEKESSGVDWTIWYIIVSSSKVLSQHNETFKLTITAMNQDRIVKTANVYLEIILNGDVDKNGYVDIADAVKIAQYTVGKYNLTKLYKRVADVDGSGDADISDAMYLAKYIAGVQGYEMLE